jgi:hypothetical protein
MLTIALTPAIEPVVRDDGSVRLVSGEPFVGSTATGKRKDIHERILSGPAADAFRSWLDTATATDLAHVISTGTLTLDVNDDKRKRGAPRQSAPTLAETLAAKSAAEAAAAPKAPKTPKGADK